MKTPRDRFLFLTAFILTLHAAYGSAQERPRIDGRFEDWTAIPAVAVDKSGDGGSSGVDFLTLNIAHDDDFLYLALEVGNELGLQEKNAAKLYIDTDGNPATGTKFHGLGAELIWSFGERKGSIWNGSGTAQIKPASFGLVTAPSVTSDRFEIAIDRKAVIGVIALFPGEHIRLMVAEQGGDQLPDGDAYVEYTFTASPYAPIPALSIAKADPATLRILTWNVLFSGPFDAAREPAFTRILKALKPDILCFQEMFDRQAEEVRAYIQSILPLTDGRQWQASKTDTGNVLVSSWPIESARQVQPVYRESAHMIRPGPPWSAPLLLINNHLRCCTANLERQAEADGLVAFIRDAKAGTGPMPLVTGTPIVLVGDFNLVGYRQQLETLLSGDIVDNGLYGPDSPPDWNGGPLEDLSSRHLHSLFTWTWGDRTSAYAAGKLDYVLFTPSALRIVADLVFDTREMTADERAHAGLQPGDSETASDHRPTVADCLPVGVSTADRIPASPGALQLHASPNPASDRTELAFSTAASGRATITLTDALGRAVLIEECDIAAIGTQRHSVSLRDVSPGMYLARVAINGGSQTVLLVKSAKR